MSSFPFSIRFSGILFNLGLGVTLAGGVIYTSHLVTKSWEKMHSTIDVKGYAESTVSSDYANWSVRVTVREQDLSKAYLKLEQETKIVEEFLKKSNISDLKVEKEPVLKNLLYDRDDKGHQLSTIARYELDQTLSFTSTNLEGVKDLSMSIDTLGKQGLEISASSPIYLVEREKLESLKKDL
ncbi:MAG TPA: SIMPL domain-containing protein, partial [Alphaproteobacteria bacterium]|nr:SIMPL domain-containing protein [Alphaproteobacteria bacterium]